MHLVLGAKSVSNNDVKALGADGLDAKCFNYDGVKGWDNV